MESILTSIKKLLGLTEDDTSFDTDITIHINSTFMVLNQLGVGPTEGFRIFDKEDTWDDYLPDENMIKVESVKTYVYLKVKLLFDPPQNGTHIESIKSQIAEFEWRMNVAVDPGD